jgi:DNA-binding SARP family transcriptional activator
MQEVALMQKLKVTMFGEFSLSYNGKTINERSRRSVKTWKLLEYILVYKDRQLPQEKLIELLWGENMTDGVGALKTQMHRLRNELAKLNYPAPLVVNTHGAYAFNNEAEIETDVEQFEKVCKLAFETSQPETRLSLARQGIGIYKGDYLPKFSSEQWVISGASFYRSLFQKLIIIGVEAAQAISSQSDVIALCERASVMLPLDTQIHKTLIRTLTEIGETQAAINHYELLKRNYSDRLGTEPPDELRALYSELNTSSADIGAVFDVLKEKSPDGAFRCNIEQFRDIYRMEMRAQQRVEQNAALFLLTLLDGENGDPVENAPEAMDRLGTVIRCRLRACDAYARYGKSQYILLLIGVGIENCPKIVERLRSSYEVDPPKEAPTFSSEYAPATTK